MSYIGGIKSNYLAGFLSIILAATIGCNIFDNQRDAELVDIILVTKNLQVGQQRVSLLLNVDSGKGQVSSGVLSVHPAADRKLIDKQIAEYHRWPYGMRGAYSTDMNFIQPGPWELEIQFDVGGDVYVGRLKLNVAEKLPVPSPGHRPPQTTTPTLVEGKEIALLTTDYSPDPELYQISIKEALQDDKPDVIVFASPGFCTSPTCGPQVDTLSMLNKLYPHEANFIHVEIYDNPSEIQGDLEKLVFVDAVEDWGFTQLPGWINESWTFVIDGDGVINQCFEGFVTLEELDHALGSVVEAH